MTDRKFYRTLVTIEVLSENPLSDDISLGDIEYGISDGDWSGDVSIGESMKVNGKAMADLLSAQGSDPGFFQIDENGNDLD